MDAAWTRAGRTQCAYVPIQGRRPGSVRVSCAVSALAAINLNYSRVLGMGIKRERGELCSRALFVLTVKQHYLVKPVGPQQGRKAFMIRAICPLNQSDPRLERVPKASGFSLHAGVSCEANQKNKRERLCRYIARSAVALLGLSLCSTSKVFYNQKTVAIQILGQYLSLTTVALASVASHS